MEKTIKINSVDYKIKQSFRALAQFETLTGKFATQVNQSITDMVTLLYCMLCANNKDTFNYSQDEFFDLLDADDKIMQDFQKYLVELAETVPAKKKK